MMKYVFFACLIGIAMCQPPQPPRRPDIQITEEHLPNGDEGEIVSIDLKRRDGTNDLRIVTRLRFHLNASHVMINGHPVVHSRVNSVRMRISISEVRDGKMSPPKLSPVTFRVLVMETKNTQGLKKLITQFQFVRVRQFDVLQIDVKQIIWEGSNRKPLTSISIQESAIRHHPSEHDHHIFVPDPGFGPKLPSHGLRGNVNGYGRHRNHNEKHRHDANHFRHHHHRFSTGARVLCWFRRLNIAGKIAVICSAVFLLFGIVVLLVVCCRRYCFRKNPVLEIPIDNYVEVENVISDEKKTAKIDSTNDGVFHMEINSCAVEFDDKKSLVD